MGLRPAAIGKRIRHGAGTPWREIIGVVEDVRNNGVQGQPPAIVYWPSRVDKMYPSSSAPATLRSLTLALRSDRAGTASYANEIREAIWSWNSNLPVTGVRTMQEIYDHSLARTSFTMVMLGIASSMALLLGVVGIYGVIAYAVSQRRREIGIRVALGAQQRELKKMFVRDGLVTRGRHRNRARGVGSIDAVDEGDPVRDQPDRCADLRSGSRRAARRGSARQLHSGQPRREGRSDRSFEGGIT